MHDDPLTTKQTTTPDGAPQGGGPFQVLALDGGGVRGIFVAALLAGLEMDLGCSVVEHFDLVVGTSTGGIIALGLGAGLSPREILEFYVGEKDRIFSGPNFARKLRQVVRPKYPASGLERAVRGVFDDRLLGESVIPLVVPSYNLGDNAVYLFKTPHHPRLRRDHRVPMWAVAMATSAAPTFFPAFRLPGEHVRLIDGGIWANNPSVVGVTEAVSMFGRSLDDIKVLSVGTTESVSTRPSKLDNAGLLRWLRAPHVVEILMRGQSVGAFAQLQHLVGMDDAHRLDAPAGDELNSLDRCDARELIAKASHHSRRFSPIFEAQFQAHHAPTYRPMYGPNAQGVVP
jgi:predicted acylesterase/phospholipase RssA